MNRIPIWVPAVAAAACCLVAAGASAQPQPVPAPLPQVRPAPPAPPAPPGFKTLVPFDSGFARDMAKDMAALYKDAWRWNDPGAWGWPFQNPRQTTGRSGATQTESMDMAFSNPATPGTLELHLFSGSVLVKGTNRKDASIRVTHRGGDTAFERDAPPPPAGMRRLSAGRRGSLSVEEDNNRIEVRSRTVNSEMDLEIELPVRTNLELRVVNGGEIAVEGVEGSIEVNNVNGPVRLTGVSGSVVASSVNANVTVRLTRVTDAKAMAFSSLSGTVDVTLPATTKANLKLRSDNGDVFTDFDVQQTEPPARSGFVRSDRSDKRVRFESNNTIYGTINGGGPEIEARSFNGSVFIRKAQ
jgi:DUF4097 and DUF4098 domain-containing protein YvlB